MKKNLLLLLVSFFSLTLTSQITITSANMPNVSDTIRYSKASLTSVGDYTATGANNVWDFSTLIPTGQNLHDFKTVSQTPYGIFSFFVSSLTGAMGEKITDTLKIPSIAGIISQSLTITDVYNFYKNQSTNFSNSAIGLKINGFPVPNSFLDKDELYMFPLSYGNPKDSTTFSFSTITSTLVPFVYKKAGYRITEVDGWGSITTPYGTEPCIRVLTTQYSQDTIIISALPPGFNKIGFPNYVKSYQWLTLGEKIPYLEVSGNLIGTNFTPTQAKYRDVIRTFVGIKEEAVSLALSVFPNPANTELTVIIPQNTNNVVAEITDLQGKIIITKSLNQNTGFVNQHQIDVSGMAKGVYLLKLSTGTSKQTLKISVQ